MLSYAQFKLLRKKTIDNILCTDTKGHYDMMKDFENFMLPINQ